jgi:hypothetical protein
MLSVRESLERGGANFWGFGEISVQVTTRGQARSQGHAEVRG